MRRRAAALFAVVAVIASVLVVARPATVFARCGDGLFNTGEECDDGDLGGLLVPFAFGPAINVTCVQEVKGLEFDLVVVLDASAAVYPATQAAARALYVTVTRASRKLVLSTVGSPSPFVASLAHDR